MQNEFWHQINLKKVLCCTENFGFRIEDKGLWTSTKLFWGLSSRSVASVSVSPGTATRQASLSFTISYSLLKLMSFELVMSSNHLILCHPLLLPLSIFPSIRVFSNDSALCIRWPNYWHFSFSVSCSNEYSGMISFRIDWFDLLDVQGTLKSLLQNQISKASVFSLSAFFMVQPSHPYMTNGITIFWLPGHLLTGKVSTFKYAIYVCHSLSSK